MASSSSLMSNFFPFSYYQSIKKMKKNPRFWNILTLFGLLVTLSLLLTFNSHYSIYIVRCPKVNFLLRFLSVIKKICTKSKGSNFPSPDTDLKQNRTVLVAIYLTKKVRFWNARFDKILPELVVSEYHNNYIL